jgi:hypothetical protein
VNTGNYDNKTKHGNETSNRDASKPCNLADISSPLIMSKLKGKGKGKGKVVPVLK